MSPAQRDTLGTMALVTTAAAPAGDLDAHLEQLVEVAVGMSLSADRIAYQPGAVDADFEPLGNSAFKTFDAIGAIPAAGVRGALAKAQLYAYMVETIGISPEHPDAKVLLDDIRATLGRAVDKAPMRFERPWADGLQ